MIVRLHGLGKGRSEIRLQGSPEQLQLPAESFTQPVDILLILEDTGDVIKADFQIETKSRRICDRCARDFDMPLKINLRMRFIPSTSDYFTDDIDIKSFHPDRPQVDIAEDVHDALLLAIPFKVLCKQDCKGICPGCGADLNEEECSCKAKPVDPRWSELEKLKNSLEG
jgi:uncharacterized protein